MQKHDVREKHQSEKEKSIFENNLAAILMHFDKDLCNFVEMSLRNERELFSGNSCSFSNI